MSHNEWQFAFSYQNDLKLILFILIYYIKSNYETNKQLQFSIIQYNYIGITINTTTILNHANVPASDSALYSVSVVQYCQILLSQADSLSWVESNESTTIFIFTKTHIDRQWDSPDRFIMSHLINTIIIIINMIIMNLGIIIILI